MSMHDNYVFPFQMLYLSSASGFYFPWDFCLYPGMTALVSFSPRFTPALIATIMATVAAIGAYYKRCADCEVIFNVL